MYRRSRRRRGILGVCGYCALSRRPRGKAPAQPFLTPSGLWSAWPSEPRPLGTNVFSGVPRRCWSRCPSGGCQCRVELATKGAGIYRRVAVELGLDLLVEVAKTIDVHEAAREDRGDVGEVVVEAALDLRERL